MGTLLWSPLFFPQIESIISTGKNFELINIDIIRENAQTPVPMNALGDVCSTLVKIFDDTPNAFAYYFCNYVSEIPEMREREGKKGKD